MARRQGANEIVGYVLSTTAEYTHYSRRQPRGASRSQPYSSHSVPREFLVFGIAVLRFDPRPYHAFERTLHRGVQQQSPHLKVFRSNFSAGDEQVPREPARPVSTRRTYNREIGEHPHPLLRPAAVEAESSSLFPSAASLVP